ncbi:ankyrin-2-like isoform X20 [Portunus trituberculatus]|uniref:ankyrin-2-like isoform X20 n=1 Tax=Portunus trituberculatus TaxID=210409 RepID=UPI001E1CCF04|nr:ankyrin-2-like isoform X20 [Portunus trituberculatus]
MPVENDTSHQNGQQDAGGGGGNGNVPTETSSQPQQAPEPNATIVNGTHAKVSDAPEDQLAKDAPKDAKKSDGSASFLRAARAGNLEKVLEFLKTNTDINTCNANGLNALHLASKEGHVNVVRELLQRGANVDAATKKGNTALHIASLAGQEEIVKVLVQHQALVNIQSQNGFTPLYMAAQENHDSVVRFLLANNANQSLATEDGFTPLAVALQQGHDKVVAVLLENDTRGKVRLPALHIAAKKDDTKAAALLLHTDHNPDVTSKSGFTPLHIASHYGNENIANLLIQRGADVNYIAKHQITPLHVASKWGKGNMVSLLIDKGANYEAKTRDGLTPLHCAARSGHEAVVDMLLEKGAPITSKTKNGLAPLHMASQGDHVDAARILLYHKAPVDDVTVDFLTALHVAAHCGHVRVAKLLLDRKAEANARALNGFTPLHIACKKNRIKVVELLLKHGASIEATTESGLTPLHVASFMGCMNIVIYLLQHSATADVPTVRGETPLHLAARANQTDIIRILLRNGAQVDARAREQQTALHIASRLGNSDIVVLLLQHGAAVDATTKDHYTALHIAAKEGQEEVASVLLEHGASLTSTTKKGFTPLHLAAKYGNMKVARLLLQKDALVDAQGKNGVTPLHVAAHYDHQNVALLLLDKGASPHATAKNGYTPLHIAARKNQMDIATTLLEYGASANAESKAGFTPLHLSSQEGHTDMATLLIEHNAAPGACAKNGLTPLHLCGQEDRVNVAAILVKHGAQIDPVTKAGYTPLHVACHFGQMNMVRFLLQHGAKVNSTTQLGYTPLHQAAQQGHTQIVNLLLENKAEPNTETNDGKTALSIAQRLGYISVVETLKIVTETTINTTTTTTTEEKYKVVVPETMHETFMSESEDEGGDDTMVSSMFGKPQHVTLPYYEGQFRYTSDDTMLGDQSYRYLTVDEMKSLGDDSLPIDVTKDEKMDMSFSSNQMAAPPVAPADHLSPQHQKEHYAQMTASYPADNVDVGKTPILAGPESLNTTLNTTIDSAMIEAQIEPQIIQTKLAPQQMVENNTDLANNGSVSEKAAEILNGWEGFLVSFMVDARGGAMRGCRHSGVRVIIPPRKAAMPMRVTCRYLKKDKLVHAPPLMEGEALASRILEMGPAGAKFLGPVIIEVPHFASLRGKEREIVILRSDNGETWREHTLEATEEAVQEVLNESFDGEELKQLEDLNTNRITRILTTDFPQYFAIVTRIRQEVHAIGPEGGMVSSTVVPQVQAVFPQGALTKKIKVGLQAQPIPTDLVAKLLGNRVAVSPIVTVEPRRRKFHKPITLTIPVPQASSKGMINQYSGEAPTLRLLCSITGVFRKRSLKGGTTRAQWEDVTGSTPLTFVNDCVSFTTTVSARFWLMDCSNIPEATKMATELYREAIHVPFMAKFVVFSKRHQLEEARMRVFCMTDDREDKTLEHQELFVEVAKSRDVEVLEGKPQFLEFAGNLVPVTKSGDQLAFNFYAFRENRLPFTVRVKDQHADPIGRVAFMRQPKVGRGDPPQTPICNLNIALPDNIQPEPAPSEPDLLALEKKYSFLSISKADTIHRANLRLTDISNMLGTDWVALAHELEVTDSDINIIKSQYPDNAPQQAIVMLRLWMQTAGNKASGNTVGKALRKINREDIVKQCIFNVEVVTDDIERAMAKAHFDQSGFDTFKDELGPSRDATLNRDVSLDVSYDEQDMMKEAESAEEEEENQRAYHDKSSREQHTADLSPTYESEEKKYAGEEKVVTDEKVTKEEAADDSTTFTSFTATSTPIKRDTKEEEKLETDKKDKASKPAQIVPDTLQESKEETTVTDKDAKKPVEELVTKESISKEEPKSLEKEKPVTVVKEKIKEKEDDTTPMVKEKVKPEEKKEKDEKPEASQKEPEKTVTSTTKTEVVGGPKDITTVTTETKSYTTAEDGSVQEHIVVKKQTSKVVDGKEMEEDKSAILQKLGEELGKLDEQLEEKFKKRKAEKPEVVQEEVKEEAVVAQRREGQTQPTSQVVVEHGSEPPTLPATTTTTTTSITPIPDGFTQASVESSQMSSTRGTADVSFPGADTAVKQLDGAPSIFGKRPGIESFFYKGFFLPSGTHEASQPTEHQTSLPQEQAASSQPTSGTKAGSADGKTKLTEADLAVLESMVVAQEAEMEEMAFKIEAEAAQAKIELEGSYLTNNDAVSIEKGMEKQMIRNKPVNQKADVPVHSSVSISPFKSESLRCTDTDTGQHHGDPSKKTTGVASMASARESSKAVAEAPEASHISSDEGEEQLMIMRDSPRWEDEEIQAEESDEPRTIKAEIKLLVKTTEVGKESIEIRSIREFVENENADVISSEGVVQSPAVDSSQLVPGDVQHLQSTSSDLCSPSPKFTRPQVASTYSSICEPTQDEFDLMAQVRDGGLHGGCPEAQGMDWEGKSVDSMLTESVMQARLSMLPAVDTNEGVALPSQPSSTSPPVASTHLSSPSNPDLPFLTTLQPQASSSQDSPGNKSQTFLHLEPSHLHDSNSFEPQGFDVSPSSATKLSDPVLLERSFVCGAEASTASHLVASPSIASLQSESFTPFIATEELGAASVTFNTSSAMISMGPVSPTENSSEDHAEIERTSTEISPDSVRFDQDILDTRTEDEAPDLDDDLIPSSPVPGQELSERVFSIEATEDTDITTPMEMRDSHTERDASASNLIEDKEVTDGKSDLKEPLPISDKDENNAYLAQEVNDIINKVNRLQEQVKAKEIDPISARSEIKVILNTLDDVREVIEESKVEDDSEANVVGIDILSNIDSVGEMVMQMMKELHLTDPEHSEFWSKDEAKVSHETECAVAETITTEDKSPPSANQPDQSFSDLIDSEEFNRDSLEDEFDRLTADLSSPPKSDKIEFIPKAIGATAPSNDLSFPVSSVVHPPIPPDAFQATQLESDVGVVFTERKEYGGGVKTSAETTGGHSHISPSPVLHPSQSIQSSSSASFQQKLPCTTSVNVEDTQSSHDEPHVPSRPSRRHERTFSQATNIFTGAIPTETKVESKKVEDIKEEQVGITEDIKPYSERKQFWESVTSQSFESKSSHLLKSETESDTDTTGTDGTVLEQKVRKTKVSSTESNDSESEYLAQRVDPRFYENAGFAGTEKIDVSTESARERTISPFEVLRSGEPMTELPSPEDIAFKDVSSKRALFEKEIKRQSMEIEESQSWKRSSKEYDETLVVSEETASSTLKKKEERESKISETIEKDKEIKKKFESKKDDLSKTDFKTEITSKSDKSSSVEDRSEVTESSKLHQEKMQKKEEKVTSELGAMGKKSVTQRDASTEKREKEVSEKEAKIIHEKKDSYSRTFSKSISKSEEKTESSSEAKETVHTLSTDDQDTSKDEMTEEDITRTEETSDEEPEEKLAADKTTVDVTEESRQLGDTRETVVRETTTTREGDQEQRVVKETKTQETAMADGSTIKTTSITTFTTQLETKDQEESKPYSAKTAKEKAEAYVKQQMKSDIFSEELSSSAEDQSPEHKVLTPKDTIAPVSRAQKSHPLSSPILVPEEKIEDVVWEVSQERSETVLSETVEDIPVQQSYETQHVRDLSSDESRVLEKPQPEQATEATKHKLSEEEARKLAIEIVEEVKTEAVKRSPLVTPSQTFQEFPQELEDTTDGAARPPLPIPIPESAFTQETTTKIEKYIQEQLGEEMDEKQLKLIESVTAKKTELLHRKLIGGQYQHSMEITDEDLRSSGAELSPIEHHMERLRQMTEEEDNQRYAREPSEADESESSIIIHDTVDDVISSEYDQATQMISKTLDSIKTADISRVERPIDTIEELPETPVMPVVEVKERKMSEVQEVARFSDSDIKETARQIVKEVTEIAKESDVVKQASQAADSKQASGGQDQAISCSPKSGSKPGSRKGSWMDDEDLTREFRKDYEDKKKMFKEEMTSDKSDTSDAKDDGAVKVKHQRSSESQKEVPMESSMTESMEESSAVESIRSIEGKLKQETVPEIREGEIEKKIEERSSSSHEEVVMRKKTHIEEFSRRSGADFDTYSSSGESHYFTAAEGTSDSRTASRPCSSDVEALISERTGTSEYDTALTSQDTSQYSSYSSSSREYRTAASSMSSRDSMKSIDSESSGNLASVELSEASETLVPSAMELERDMDLLDQEIMEEDQSHFTQAHPSIIPQLTVQSDTPKSEGAPCTFDLESDEGESEPEVKEKEHHVASRMKRSVEMTFHPEPVPIAECKKGGVTESVASSLEESTLSEMSVVTVVERERSLQSSVHSEPSMSASGVSEQMASSSECPAAAHSIMRTDSGVLTTDTGDGDMALHSVTITATSVPSTTDSSTASMCTQVTSETRSQAELTESEQFFHANGPTEVDYVPEYDDEVRGVRPVAAPVLPPIQEVSGAVAGPSEGPQKVTVVEECYETEADQEYGQMMRESEYSDMAEAELQYSLEEQPESEMSSMLGIEEPIERPKTPEPGYVPSSRPSQVTAQSLDESEEFTEVDKRFSAIFSTTYEEREEGARSLVSGLSVDIPDIRVTEHTLPMPSQYCYPDLEREEDFPECQVQAEVDASGQDVPATPGSQESASTCASRKSSSTDSEQGREYCLDDAAQGLPFESFEMIEAGDIEDFLEYEKTLRMHEKRMLEMSQIQEEEEEEVEEEQQKVHTSPIMPSQLKAVKLEAKILRSSDSQSQVSDEGSEEADSTIEEQRRWLELQFEESSVSNFEYSQPSYMQHVYSGPLEDIEEEKEDAERRDLSHVVKGSSLSSTPEYDVLAGRKFFTRSGEHDDVSMSSLQEFENLERSVAVDAVARRSSSGSQESLNGKKPEGKSGQGDDISVGSFASLQEFERLEEECLEAENIEKKVKEEEAMLSEIEEGHESQVSESESCETMSEPGQASVDGEEYDQRMFEIDEIIRQAQTNVEKFDKTKPGYEGVQLQDIVSNGSGSSRADRTPSVGREEGDADSLEEAQLPELDLDQSAPGATSTKQDVMTLSTDSIETPVKQKVPRETSQDSLEKVVIRTSDPMATSVDSIDMASRHDPMTTSIDSLEGRRRGQDPMSASTDSIDPYRRDVMATSIDSLGKDDSSGRDADISSGSEQVRPLPRDGLMEWSTDSLEPTSSQATHAIYHQYDTDSIMSGSFASGCSNTLVASTEGLPDMMTSSMYLPEGELPPLEGEGQHTHYVHTSSGSAAETVAPSSEPGFSHSVTRVVKLPPEAHQVTFTGPDAQKKLEEYIKGFNAGQHSVQDETVDDQGNVHIRRVTQTRIVAEPERTQEHGFSVSEPSTVETEECDEHGNVTRVIRRTVVTSHTIEVDLDTGEPIVQASSSTPSKSSTSASTSTSSPSISRIPRPVTSPPQSRSQQPGPPPGLRGPCEPVPPSLEPNTVSGLDVEEMSSGMEGYASDGNDPMTTTHITRYDPDPLPITTSTTTTTTTTTTRIIRRTKEEDGEVKEEEEIFEEY